MRAILAAHQAAVHPTTTRVASSAAQQAAQAARNLHLPVDNQLFLLLLAVAIGWGIAAVLRGRFGR
jgi:cell division protein FtsX